MSESNKILTSEYLDWHTKLIELPSILTDKIWFNLYKKYKKEIGHELWQLSEDHLFINSKPENKVSYLSSSDTGQMMSNQSSISYQSYILNDSQLIVTNLS